MLRVPRPPPLRRASCGYITRGGRGGWRSARAALSLSNSPGEAAGELSLPSLGENWVSTGLGARHEGLSLGGVGVRGRGAPPELCLSRVAQIPSPAESPAALIASRAGYRAAPRCFGGADVPGRAEPSPGGVQQGRGGHKAPVLSFLPVRPPRGGGCARGCPGFPHSQHGRGRGWQGGFVFLRCHRLQGPQRPLVRRPLSFRGDYLLAAALFCPGHGACVGCGSCAGKPQSPWSDRGMGPLALPLPAPGLTPAGPDRVPGWGTGTAGSSHRVLQPLGLSRVL